MKVGTVTGRVWATKRHELLPPGALVEIKVDKVSSLIALDSFGVGLGDQVLVIQGSVAARYCNSAVDAVVVGIVDHSNE